MTKKNSKRKMRLIAALIFLIFGVVIALLVVSLKPDETVEFDQTLPGAARDGFVVDQDAVVDRLVETSKKLLLTDRGYRIWQMPADRVKGLPAESSADCLTLDQVMAARYHLEQRDQKALLADLAQIQTFYLTKSGLPTDRITVKPDGPATKSETISVASTLAWLRILAESYSLTGEEAILDQLKAASDTFLDMISEDGTLPADTMIALLEELPRQDPAATPTIRPSATPTPAIIELRPAIRLAEIDLYAIKLMTGLDERWQIVYDRQRSILSGSISNSDIRLPAYAYDPGSQDYIGFSGSQPLVIMEDALLVLQHLYEAGEPQDEYLSYVRGRFLSDGAVYGQVHRATGDRLDDQECVIGYASLARIARMSDDPLLYERATARLAWHIATSPRSEALGAVFQTDPDGRVRVFASNNLAALTAFR